MGEFKGEAANLLAFPGKEAAKTNKLEAVFMIKKLFKRLIKTSTSEDTTGEDLHSQPPFIYTDSSGKTIKRPYIPSSYITVKKGL